MSPRRALLAAPLLLALPARAEERAALAALRSGGVNLLLRHAITDRGQSDSGVLGDCAGQRNLSEAGREQSRRIGGAIRRLSVPVGRVLTSPVCRSRETAALAFGPGGYALEPALTADDYAGGRFRAEVLPALRRLLSTPPAGGRSDVMVGHIVPAAALLGRPLSQESFP